MCCILSILFLVVLNSAIICGVNDKRADDNNPLENVVMQLSASLDRLMSKVTSLETNIASLTGELNAERKHVAFLAQFSATTVTTPAAGAYHFDHVVFNDGGAYNSDQGIFTTPFNGVYTFQLKLYTSGHQEQHPVFDIMLNGNTQDRLSLGPAFPAGSDAEQSSQSTTFTIRLVRGDQVWVQAYDSRSYAMFGGFHSLFSGALIYAD